jgi:hypothetical protein
MPVTTDIVATYRGPRRVFARLLAMGHREDRALILLMSACSVAFISQWPALARQSHVTGQELDVLIGGALMAWLFVAPLLLYGLAALSHIIAKLLRGQGDWFGARLALFWSMLAASPLLLLHGLVGGFIGDSQALNIVGFLWFAIFIWFWISCLIEAERSPS